MATTPYPCGSIRTPHSECIFPQGQRTPTLGTSNNLLEYSHCGELNKGPLEHMDSISLHTQEGQSG